MKLSSALESTKTCTGSGSHDHWRDVGRMIRARGLVKEVVWLTNVTLFTGEPGLLAEPDRWRYSKFKSWLYYYGVRADHSRYTDVD